MFKIEKLINKTIIKTIIKNIRYYFILYCPMTKNNNIEILIKQI